MGKRLQFVKIKSGEIGDSEGWRYPLTLPSAENLEKPSNINRGAVIGIHNRATKPRSRFAEISKADSRGGTCRRAGALISPSQQAAGSDLRRGAPRIKTIPG
jgi:hypothetical protein